MELAAAAFTALTSTFSNVGSALGMGGATATTAAATAAPLNLTAGAAGAAASSGFLGVSGSTWLSAMQLGLGGLSAASTLAAGDQKADQLNAAASDAEAQVGNEMIVGQERRASLKRQAADATAERLQAYAAGGMDLSFGTPQTAQAQDVKDAEHALAIDQGTEEQRIARLRTKAAEYRASAKSARSASLMKAFVGGAETGFGLTKRGNLFG